MFKSKFFITILVLLNLCFAFVLRSEGQIIIGSEETITDDLYLLGNTIQIDGVIEGDLFALAKKIIINGEIKGDLTCAGATIYLHPQNANTVRALGKDIYFKGIINQDFICAGEKISFHESAYVNNNFAVAANEVILAGTVSGNTDIRTGSLQIDANTFLGGNLTYGAHQTEISREITVQGERKIMEKEFFHKNILTQKIKEKMPWVKIVFNKIFGNLYSVIVLFIFGVIVIKFMPAQTTSIINEITGNPYKSLLLGFLTCLITPLISLLLALTVIGIPFALIVFSFFGLGFYMSKIFVCIILGKWFLTQVIKKELLDSKKNLLREMFVGIIIYYLILNIPVFGLIFAGLTTLISIGAFMGTRKDMYIKGLKKGVF